MLRALMGRLLVAAAIGTALVAATARAEADDDVARLVLDTGRPRVPAPEPDTYRLVLKGEHQVRYQAEKSFPLVATPSAIAAAGRGGALTEQSLGQNQLVHHWLRLTPHLQLRDTLEIVAQLDLVTGLVLGDKARDTRADETPRDTYNGFGNVQPRWLYADYKLPFGHVRIGQQPNHWAMGILANDGDHPTLFGDYRYGTINERLLFATKPGGTASDFHLAVAGDLVFRDPLARLTRGEQALSAVVATYWQHEGERLGVYAAYRHQTVDRGGYTDALDQVSIDLTGRVEEPVPGQADAFIYGEIEAIYVIGQTNLARTADQAEGQIRAYGGAAKLGVVHRERGRPLHGGAGSGDVTYGDIVGELEIGYASGDADPYDGTLKRFTFDPNHRVGLLLFDEVLRFQTARSATAATDPLLGSTARPLVGVDLLPSNGGVFGAQYVNPTGIWRPRSWLDLKGGMVIAQATSEIVDPYRVATTGSYVNYRGGDPKRLDLGLELDGGFEARLPLENGVVAQAGAQAGVLFPGRALDGIGTPWIAIGRLGLLF